MPNFKFVVGIDVAKDTLAVSIFDGREHQRIDLEYQVAKFNKLVLSKIKDMLRKDALRKDTLGKDTLHKSLSCKTTCKNTLNNDTLSREAANEEVPFADVLFIMENTGVYHQKLADYLKAKGKYVSVVNPFVIKKYAEMMMKRAKTDSVDSKLIAQYGYYTPDIQPYTPKAKTAIEIDNILKAVDDLNTQRTVSKNQLHALQHQTNPSLAVLTTYAKHIEFLDIEIKKLKDELNQIIDTHHKGEHELLTSIPGVGLTISSMVIGIFNSFASYESAKQASSFAGICPSPHESGTSVKYSGKISKRGNSFARKMLYMAALSAMKCNIFCRNLYERLLANGKSKKQALIAAANKLLRQAFGVLKSQKAFDVNYVVVFGGK